MPTRRRALLILAALAGLSQLSIALALMVGSIPISPAEVLATLFGDDVGMAGDVVRSLRLPRALTGFACGGLLALAGALLQVLLRNPLADPYVLGISGGAGIGALLAIVLGLRRRRRQWPGLRRCARSDAAGFRTGAWRGWLDAVAPAADRRHRRRRLRRGRHADAGNRSRGALRGMLFWLMGDLSQTGDPQLVLILLVWCFADALPFARELNLLARGADIAQALGVAVAPCAVVFTSSRRWPLPLRSPMPAQSASLD
jgi:iron complex transport system permease protein